MRPSNSPPQLVRPHLRLVDQQVRVARHARPPPHRHWKQLRELARVPPDATALIQDQRHDRAQLLLSRMPLPITLPDPDAVLQQPQAQPPVRRGLVLQQHVEPRRCAVGRAPDGVQQVRFACAQAVVDEACRLPLEAGPEQFAADRRWQVCLQQSDRLGFPVLPEHGTEQVIVGLGDFAGHGLAATVGSTRVDVNVVQTGADRWKCILIPATWHLRSHAGQLVRWRRLLVPLPERECAPAPQLIGAGGAFPFCDDPRKEALRSPPRNWRDAVSISQFWEGQQ